MRPSHKGPSLSHILELYEHGCDPTPLPVTFLKSVIAPQMRDASQAPRWGQHIWIQNQDLPNSGWRYTETSPIRTTYRNTETRLSTKCYLIDSINYSRRRASTSFPMTHPISMRTHEGAPCGNQDVTLHKMI